MRDADGRPMTVKARVDTLWVGNYAEAIRREHEGMAAWAAMDDPGRRMVQAVVRAALKRLLEDPKWIPGSVRLGDDRLDIAIVVELDETQVSWTQAVRDLDIELLEAGAELDATLADLGGPDEGPA